MNGKVGGQRGPLPSGGLLDAAGLLTPQQSRALAVVTGTPHPAGITVAELAKELGVHVNTAREHLQALEELGLVRAQRAPEYVGRGRPQLVYIAQAPRPSAMFSQFVALVQAAFELRDDGGWAEPAEAEPAAAAEGRTGGGAGRAGGGAGRAGGGAGVVGGNERSANATEREFARAWGRKWARVLCQQSGAGACEAQPGSLNEGVGLGVGDARGLVVTRMRELGFAPAVEGETVLLRRCPLMTEGGTIPPAMCQIHEGMLEQMLADASRAGVDGERSGTGEELPSAGGRSAGTGQWPAGIAGNRTDSRVLQISLHPFAPRGCLVQIEAA